MQSAASHPDLLEEPERLARPFTFSILFHGALGGALLLTTLYHSNRSLLGDQSPGAGVQVTAVSKIPIMQKQGRVNPLASETESIVPQAPPVVKLRDQRPETTAPPDKAIEIPTDKPIKNKAKPEKLPKDIAPEIHRQSAQYRPPDERLPNQVYSRTPEALKSSQIGLQGANGVGIGPNSPFGFQFGAYARQIRDLVAQKWNQAGVSASPAMIATITFKINRDGSVSNIQVEQASGSYTLDSSAKRAVLDASPLPPLPTGFNRSQADVEFLFQLRP